MFLQEHLFLGTILKKRGVNTLLGERIKIVRKNEKLSQELFAVRLSVTRNIIAKYETNLVEPTEIFIKYLCKEFGVSEHWMKTGEGDIYAASTSEDFFSEKIGEILMTENEVIKEIVTKASELDEDYLNMLNQLIDSMLNKQMKHEKK